MNGKSISYKTFYDELNQYTEVAKLMGQNPSSEEAQQALRDAAWQSIFDNEVYLPKAQAAGLNVGEQEMLDLTQGNNISPVLTQMSIFSDGSGFSREALASFVQSIDSDESGQSAAYWAFLEESIYRNQMFEKYNSLVGKSDFITDIEKNRLVAENNVTVDADFVFVPIPFADSTVTVSNEEIRQYYNERKELFRQPANRDIEYVMWEVVPSAQDYADAREEFDALYEQFKTAENLKSFVTLNSDSKWNNYFFTEDQLAAMPEIQEIAFHAPMGTVSDVISEDRAYAAGRVAAVRMMPDSVRLMFRAFPLSQEAEADAFVAEQQKKANPDEFTEMGWLTQEIMLQNGLNEFDPVFDSPQKVLKIKSANNQAIFVLYTPEKTKPIKKVQVATLLKNVLPSDDTYREYQMKAVEFADACKGKLENFERIAREQQLPVIPINNMTQETRRIGPADNAREVVYWVFDKKTKAGDVSDLKIVDNKYYFVTAVTKTRKEGYVDVNEAAEQIRPVLTARKLVDKKLAEVKEKIAGVSSLEQVAEDFGTTVSHQTGLSFGSMAYGQTDPMFLGAVTSADEGVIQAAPGSIGVYVFEVMNRQAGSFFTDSDVATTLTRRAAVHTNAIQSVLADEADIKDNRAKFF
jgi:peptidyl-prolyl cis-trans isomerase D